MSDTPFQSLLAELTHAEGKALLIADENLLQSPTAFSDIPACVITLSNRYDLYLKLKQHGHQVMFSDFDLSGFANVSIDAIYYRTSKEKPVVHHVINEAYRTLTPGGKLYLSGGNSEGIKTYVGKATKLLGREVSIDRSGSNRLAVIERTDRTGIILDDKNYPELRPIAEQDNVTFYSKPGLFGWNKIDQGSHFLLEWLETYMERQAAPERLLDLGCGYGYLSLLAQRYQPKETIAVDNNTAAILACQHNFALNQIAGKVVPDDCAHSLKPAFDLILCNPPFHQGFSVEQELTRRFLKSTARLLAKKGSALFVVNRFIGLEKHAEKYFRKVEKVAENRSFKLAKLVK